MKNLEKTILDLLTQLIGFDMNYKRFLIDGILYSDNYYYFNFFKKNLCPISFSYLHKMTPRYLLQNKIKFIKEEDEEDFLNFLKKNKRKHQDVLLKNETKIIKVDDTIPTVYVNLKNIDLDFLEQKTGISKIILSSLKDLRYGATRVMLEKIRKYI